MNPEILQNINTLRTTIPSPTQHEVDAIMLMHSAYREIFLQLYDFDKVADFLQGTKAELVRMYPNRDIPPAAIIHNFVTATFGLPVEYQLEQSYHNKRTEEFIYWFDVRRGIAIAETPLRIAIHSTLGSLSDVTELSVRSTQAVLGAPLDPLDEIDQYAQTYDWISQFVSSLEIDPAGVAIVEVSFELANTEAFIKRDGMPIFVPDIVIAGAALYRDMYFKAYNVFAETM